MAASQDHITASTPIGATLTGGGATFRVWAPGALHVHVTFDGGGQSPLPSNELVKDPVPPEYSVEWLTCAIASENDAEVVGWPGAG